MRQIYNDEIYHYGIPGMKWGKRTATNIGNGIKAQTRAGYDQIRHPVHSTKAQISMLRKNPIGTLKGGTKVLNELNADVKNRVEKRQTEVKSAVKDYRQERDKATKMSEAAEKQWQTAKEAYKKTGKTRVTAIINKIKGKSPEVKAYKKEYDKADTMDDKAAAQWDKVQEAYKKTGKNKIGAIINNIKY